MMNASKPARSILVIIPSLVSLALAGCGSSQATRAESAPAYEAVAAPEAAGSASAGASRAPDSSYAYGSDEDSDASSAPAAGAAPEEPAAEAELASAPSAPDADSDDRPEPAPVAGDSGPAVIARAGVKAGEWDDNANYREFLAYLRSPDHSRLTRLDVSLRQFLVVRDAAGNAVPNCEIEVRDAGQRAIRMITMSSGRAILFPRAEGLRDGELTATARCLGTARSVAFVPAPGGGRVVIDLPRKRASRPPTIDIAFVLDSTGSMSEEIAAVKATIHSVAQTLEELGVPARIGLVEFKDRSDPFVTRVYPMTDNVAAFAGSVSSIAASGGGDTPESVNEGLHVALDELRWNRGASARLAFLIGDAEPHLDYQKDVHYAQSMQSASRRGIQIFTIAASGMSGLGQLIWRQIAQYTGGTNMFVLRGGAGPQSVGGGDPARSCGGSHENYASGNLDALIVGKIRQSLVAMDADPTRIPGLDRDEKAKPCDQRITIVAR